MRYFYLLVVLAALWGCGQGKSSDKKATAGADTVYQSALIAPLTDSIRQFPTDPAIYFRRALLLFNTHPGLAQRDFEQAARLDGSNTDYWAGAGEAALIAEDFPVAAQHFAHALSLQPGYPYLQYKLAMAMTEAGEYDAADSLATLLSHQVETRDQAFYLKARMAEDRKDTAAAISHLRAAVAAAGVHSEYEAVMELAGLLQATGGADAPLYYKLAFRLDSLNAEPLHALGQYYVRQGKPEHAIGVFKHCIAVDPAYAAAYVSIGKVHYDRRQWKEALLYFQLGAKAAPADADCYYYRGRCYEETGQREAAIADYNKALSFRKDHVGARQALAALEAR